MGLPDSACPGPAETHKKLTHWVTLPPCGRRTEPLNTFLLGCFHLCFRGPCHGPITPLFPSTTEGNVRFTEAFGVEPQTRSRVGAQLGGRARGMADLQRQAGSPGGWCKCECLSLDRKVGRQQRRTIKSDQKTESRAVKSHEFCSTLRAPAHFHGRRYRSTHSAGKTQTGPHALGVRQGTGRSFISTDAGPHLGGPIRHTPVPGGTLPARGALSWVQATFLCHFTH